MFIPVREVRREIGRRRARFEMKKWKIFPLFSGTNDTAKGPERTNCPFGESRKYIVKEGTELVGNLPTSLDSEVENTL